MQLFGIINWNKHQQDSEVVVKKLSIKNTICMFIGVAVLSVGFGFLLSLIPSQNMAYLDSVCQIINVFGVLLNILRYRESWWVWLVNNIINEVIWVINVINHTPSAEMMLISSTMYLIMNFVSIYSWLKIENKQKQQRQEIV
jgi:nicotinamide mononucleotide transporter